MPEDRREPVGARLSLLLLLGNLFVWVGLRGTDVLLVTLASTLLALAGWVGAQRARRKIRRAGGRMSGETMALIGYWGNLLVFILAFLMFSYAVAMGILRGDLL